MEGRVPARVNRLDVRVSVQKELRTDAEEGPRLRSLCWLLTARSRLPSWAPGAKRWVSEARIAIRGSPGCARSVGCLLPAAAPRPTPLAPSPCPRSNGHELCSPGCSPRGPRQPHRRGRCVRPCRGTAGRRQPSQPAEQGREGCRWADTASQQRDVDLNTKKAKMGRGGRGRGSREGAEGAAVEEAGGVEGEEAGGQQRHGAHQQCHTIRVPALAG